LAVFLSVSPTRRSMAATAPSIISGRPTMAAFNQFGDILQGLRRLALALGDASRDERRGALGDLVGVKHQLGPTARFALVEIRVASAARGRLVALRVPIAARLRRARARSLYPPRDRVERIVVARIDVRVIIVPFFLASSLMSRAPARQSSRARSARLFVARRESRFGLFKSRETPWSSGYPVGPTDRERGRSTGGTDAGAGESRETRDGE